MIVAARRERPIRPPVLGGNVLEPGGGAGGPPRAVGALGPRGRGPARHLAPARLRVGGEGRAARAPARRPRTHPAPSPGAPAGRRAVTPPDGARRGEGDPLVMSVVEAARLLGISKTLAYDLVARKELPSLRLGGRVRIPRRALERLTESRREPSPDVPPSPRKGSGRRPERAPAPASPAGIEGGPPTRSRARRSNRRDPDPQSTTQLTLFEIPLQPPTRSATIPTATPPTSTTPEPHPYRAFPPTLQHDTSAPGVRQ